MNNIIVDFWTTIKVIVGAFILGLVIGAILGFIAANYKKD